MFRTTLLPCFLCLVSGQQVYSIQDILTDTPAPTPAPAIAGSNHTAIAGSNHTADTDFERADRKSFADKMSHVDWADASRKIVSGMITTFFRKVNLNPTEKECLDEKIGEFVGDITGVVTDAVEALSKVFGKKAETHNNLRSGLPYLLDSISRITSLVEASVTLFRNSGKQCLQADGLAVLNQTAKNLGNFKWIENRLIVNGVPITQALADAVIDFEKERFSGFGENIGLALRKVALSTSNNPVHLPEGEATEEAIAQASEGIATGFFPKGAEMIITDVKDDRVDIRVDLHQCIVDNHLVFKDIFKSVWEAIAGMAVNPEQHQFGDFSGGQPVWIEELVAAFARLPMALTKCDMMDESVQDMLGEAMQSLGSLRFDFKFPDDRVTTDQATEKVAYAVDRFSKGDYEGFGHELGKLFRELLLVVMPQKYSVDVSGRLVRNLDVPDLLAKQQKQFSPMLVFGGVVLMLVMALVGLKTLRLVKGWQSANRDSELITVEAPEIGQDAEQVLE